MLEITFGSAAFLCLCGLIWTARGMGCFLAALLLHELGHLAVMAVCRVPMRGVRLGFGEVVICADGLSRREELLCAGAGPAVNLLLWLAFRNVCAPFAAVNLLLGLYNLLPVLPLDGGRLCLAALELALPERIALRIGKLIGAAAVAALLATAALARRELGPAPLLLAAGLGLRLAAARK